MPVPLDLLSVVLQAGLAAQLAPPAPTEQVEAVEIHPFSARVFSCTEHPEGKLAYIGDALGTDCLIQGGFDEMRRGPGEFLRSYRTNGLTNEDWFGWNEPVLAPFDGIVEKVGVNSVTNVPGTMGKPPASMIVFARADGARVLYAHIQDILVSEGDSVNAGQKVAKIGNNGMSWSPHIHVGAWRDKRPLQIRWDLRALSKLR